LNPLAEHHQEQTAQPQEQCRHDRPSLWLIAEPRREHGQHRPTQREPAQERARELAFLCRDERRGNEK
jgi:hypothetical protein